MVIERKVVMKDKKTLRNMKVMFFDEERRTVSVENIKNVQGDTIESSNGLIHLGDADIYTDEWNGNIYYVYNCDLPGKVEVENLKKLRRSAALSNIFNYKSAKPFDLMGFMPWVALIISLFAR